MIHALLSIIWMRKLPIQTRAGYKDITETFYFFFESGNDVREVNKKKCFLNVSYTFLKYSSVADWKHLVLMQSWLALHTDKCYSENTLAFLSWQGLALVASDHGKGHHSEEMVCQSGWCLLSSHPVFN